MRNNIPQRTNKGIYILTNTVNSKQYVGMDSNMPQRFKQHIRGTAKCALLHEALISVGLEKWTVQFIPYPGISHKALQAVEHWYICKLETKYPDGYNMREGSNPNPKPKRKKRKQEKRFSRVSPERAREIERARECRAKGDTLKEVAEEFGVSANSVYTWCKGITPKKKTKQTRSERQQNREQSKDKKAHQKQEALRLYASGMLSSDIAEKVKVGRSTIYRWIDRIDL